MRFKSHFGSKQYLFILIVPLVVTLVAAAAIACGPSDKAGAGRPAPPSPTPGTIEPGSNHDGLGLTKEEGLAILGTARAEGHITYSRGPETAGTTIEIAGRAVKLPDDVFIAHRYLGGTCSDHDRCPKPPIYQLARGNSTIWVGSDGLMLDEKTAEGEENAFDFLREALR